MFNLRALRRNKTVRYGVPMLVSNLNIKVFTCLLSVD